MGKGKLYVHIRTDSYVRRFHSRTTPPAPKFSPTRNWGVSEYFISIGGRSRPRLIPQQARRCLPKAQVVGKELQVPPNLLHVYTIRIP